MTNELINKITNDSVTIRVPKGTTVDFEIEIEDESTGRKYEPTESTKVVFGVKRNWYDSDLVISKELEYQSSSNSYTLRILPDDTENLSCGRYYYDISLSEGEDYFVQILPTSVFMISPSVTTNPAQGV